MIFRLIRSGIDKLKSRLGSMLGSRIRKLFQGKLSEDEFDALEELLYEADLGVKTAAELTDLLREKKNITGDEALALIREEILKYLNTKDLPEIETPCRVILVVGVNGNGKTTSCARLASFYKEAGQKVLLGAADTFRAAAIDQMEMWAKKIDVDIVSSKPGSDPAAVAFDTVLAAKSRGAGCAIIDTAGRLHTKTDLMQELAKIRKSCGKALPGAPHETYLVLDATTGQNAVDQAKIFSKYTPLSGLILTKMDGTAKGGIVVAIQRELGIPVKFLGLGEGEDDLQPFDPKAFVDALLS